MGKEAGQEPRRSRTRLAEGAWSGNRGSVGSPVCMVDVIALRLVDIDQSVGRSVKLCASTQGMREMGGLGGGREVPSIVPGQDPRGAVLQHW